MKNLSILSLLMTLVLLSACATLIPIPEPLSTQRSGNPLDAYARVLQTYVNKRGEVDFPALQKHQTDLDSYVAYVAQLKASSISNPNERLAHYINSYNALSMYNVLASGIPKTHAGWAKVRFFCGNFASAARTCPCIHTKTMSSVNLRNPAYILR